MSIDDHALGDAERLGLRSVEITDERTDLARSALKLIEHTFARQDRHSIDELQSEIEEKRLELLRPYDFHLIVLASEAGIVHAAGIGVYLAGVNCGFVDYLAVSEEYRGRGLGHALRDQLAAAFDANAIEAGHGRLNAILGEVRSDNPWLIELVRNGRAIPLHLTYYHPGLPLGGEKRYVLYRQPVGDLRQELPAAEVRRIIYAVFRRAYRVRYPTQRENFRAMIEELDTREIVGPDPEVMQRAKKA
jgi:ribosomal protein S18 acetylase RimI-like enzyme